MSQNSSDLMSTNVRQNENGSMLQIKSYINEMIASKEVSISANRIKLNTSRGIWRPTHRLVEVVNNRNINNYMGFTHNCIKFLNPFEALFLMECELIEVYYEDIPLSIEESFQLFFNNGNELHFYRVYSLLSRAGYYVKQHEKLDKKLDSDQNADHLINYKRKLSVQDNGSQYDCSKHSSVDTNYYELSTKISNYKLMTNIRRLNMDLLPQRLAIEALNDLTKVNTTDSRLNEHKLENSEKAMSENQQSIFSNQSIIYDIEDNETPVELDSSLALFKGNVKPLCSLAAVLSSSQLYNLIKSVGPQSNKPRISTCSEFDSMLDVYKPDNKLDESPLFHVIITEANEPMPHLNDIIYLKQNLTAKQIYFAVIDSGDINFYCLSQFHLNDEFPVLWEKCLEPLPH